MLTAFIKFSDGHTTRTADPAELSRAFHDLSAQFWVDLSAPTETEYALLKDPLWLPSAGGGGCRQRGAKTKA